jgi:hypothetical protein
MAIKQLGMTEDDIRKFEGRTDFDIVLHVNITTPWTMGPSQVFEISKCDTHVKKTDRSRNQGKVQKRNR